MRRDLTAAIVIVAVFGFLPMAQGGEPPTSTAARDFTVHVVDEGRVG